MQGGRRDLTSRTHSVRRGKADEPNAADESLSRTDKKREGRPPSVRPSLVRRVLAIQRLGQGVWKEMVPSAGQAEGTGLGVAGPLREG